MPTPTIPETDRAHHKTAVIVAIVVPVALLHFVTGSGYRGPYPEFVNGYLLDILLPAAFYFLLCVPKLRYPDSWVLRSLPLFAACSAIEISQYLGYQVFGCAFDPVDFAMYATGLAAAAVLDRLVFPRFLESWLPHSR
ncbi:MAG: hypothetical protein QGI83_23350 [Candidatus Latescibacteria bacterium]|jgi:hypothetical protein|nr:hypothetical protein [Candidatus Latescibacterota bacterium]